MNQFFIKIFIFKYFLKSNEFSKYVKHKILKLNSQPSTIYMDLTVNQI